MRKYNKIEKVIIATSNDNYNTYDCSIHGVFQHTKESGNSSCPYKCNGRITAIENVSKLKVQFHNELFGNK